MSAEEQIREILLGMEWCHAVKTESLDEATAKINKLLIEAKIKLLLDFQPSKHTDPEKLATLMQEEIMRLSDQSNQLQANLNNSDGSE